MLTPDIYDPALNPLYRDVLAHYGVVALPCRVRDPDRKGKVEAGIGHTQKTPLKGLRFESLDAAQAYLDRWETHCVDTRIHGTTKRQVATMFAEERPTLCPLPVEPFRYYWYAERTVHLDGCVEVEAAYYGAPPGWIGRRVHVQWNDVYVRLLNPKTGQLLREHLRAPRGWHRLQDADRPARTPASILAVLARAKTAGPSISAVCEHIHQHEGAGGIRRMLGVLSLAKKHGPAVVDEAAQAAVDLGVPTYRFLRRYLERRLPAPLTLRQVDPLMRQLRLSGMASVLETRLCQAQTDHLAPIDLVSMLVSDELLRRQDRLLERRHKQARFRDPDRSLETFDFGFNKKMNRAMIYELATGRFIAQREDALFSDHPARARAILLKP